MYKVWVKGGKECGRVWVDRPLITNHTPSTSSPPQLSTDFPQLTLVIHNLSPVGGKEWQFGQLGLPSLLFDTGGELIDLVIDRTALSH